MSEREKTETGGSRKTAAEKAEEMTSAFSKNQQQLLQPHPFPHKKQKKDDDPTAVVAAVVITATATVVSTATHQTDDPKDTGAAVSTVSKQGISAAIITATVIVTSTSCATSGITTTSAITSTIGSR